MCNQLDRRVEDLLCLGRHLPFFLGETVIKELVDMRDRIEGNLLGKQFRLHRIIYINAACLVEQLVHGRLARTRCCLIGRNNNTAHTKLVMQRLQCHHQLRSRTIRVGNDVAATIRWQRLVHRVSIYFRHDQRHIVIHAECRGIVDHDTARCTSLWRDILCCVTTS